MRSAAVILIAVVVAVSARSLHDDEVQFKDFQTKFNRHYATNEVEHKFKCFRRVLDQIDERNAMDTARHGVNQFSDVCPEEFALKFLGTHKLNSFNKTTKGIHYPVNGPKNPQVSIDWRSSGAVTPIKDQGACGSCWAFAAAGSIESKWKIAGNTLVSLSDGEINQCSTNGINDGCNGGWMDDAFDWVISNHGVASEEQYPYTSGNGVTGACQTTKLSLVSATISNYHLIASSEASMATYLSTYGPLAVAVDATSWNTYTGGVMANCAALQINHGVIIVGVYTDASTPYWIIKNSWGTVWGEDGYLLLRYNTNQCAITAAPSSPVV